MQHDLRRYHEDASFSEGVLYLPVREYEYTPTVIVSYGATLTIGKRKAAKQENTTMPRT